MKEVVIDHQVTSEGSSVVELREESTPLRQGKNVPVGPSPQVSDSNDENIPRRPDTVLSTMSEEDKTNPAKHKSVPEATDDRASVNPAVDAEVRVQTEHVPVADTKNGVKPQWNPNISSYPLFKKNSDGTPLLRMKQGEDRNEGHNTGQTKVGDYIMPSISSSLESYGRTWEKLKSESQQTEDDIERRLHDDFRRAISINKIDIAVDTSITGRYAKKNYAPFGFEPSTDEACKQEDYKIIKLSNPDQKEDFKPEATPHISPLLYYQSWDPVTMRYEPKLKNSGDRAQMSQTFPLGAAAAGTRAALLSFMGTRATSNISGSPAGSVSLPSDSNRPFLRLSEVDINSHSDSAAQSRAQTPTATNVPEKIIIHPQDNDSIQRIVPSGDGGGKKIEKFDKNTADQDVRRLKRKREDDYDDKSITDSSSKQTRTSSIDTDDAICDDSSLRRGKRQRTSRTFYNS